MRITKWALQSGPPQIRVDILDSFATHLIDTKPFLPELLAALLDSDIRVVKAAANTLWELGTKAECAVPRILRAMKAIRARAACAHALCGIAPANPAVVAAITSYLKEKGDVETQVALIALLERAGPAAKDAVPQLIKAIDDPREKRGAGEQKPVQASAIKALGEIGVHAKPALQRLFKLVKDAKQPMTTRQAAARAIKKIDERRGQLADRILLRAMEPD
jgi:HEAT repeat protein